MSTISSPYGLKPISHLSGVPRPLRIPLGIANSLGSNIFKFQPVYIAVASGTITPVTATTDRIFGVFAGCEYTPVGGRPTESPFWPTGTTYDTTFDMFAYVWPAWDSTTRWQIQADGAVAQTTLGAQFNFVNFGNGSTVTGLSSCQANHTMVAAGGNQGQLFLQEFATDINDTVGDAFTDLIVGIAFPQVGLGVQNSIG